VDRVHDVVHGGEGVLPVVLHVTGAWAYGRGGRSECRERVMRGEGKEVIVRKGTGYTTSFMVEKGYARLFCK
jgi:hypothetical protein